MPGNIKIGHLGEAKKIRFILHACAACDTINLSSCVRACVYEGTCNGMCVFVHAHAYILYIYVWYVYVHLCLFICVYVHMSVCLVCVCVCVCMCKYVHVCISTHMCCSNMTNPYSSLFFISSCSSNRK